MRGSLAALLVLLFSCRGAPPEPDEVGELLAERYLPDGGVAYRVRKLSSGALAEGQAFERYVFEQPADRSTGLSRVVRQRVDVVGGEAGRSGAPVVFNLSGESTATVERLSSLWHDLRDTGRWALVRAEHRGYGKSLSEDEEQSVPSYVRYADAVEDAHAVAQFFKESMAGPWAVVGYSYAGSLALELGMRHPDDVRAVLSSSGVVRWPFLFRGHDRAVRALFGEAVGARLADHVARLRPKQAFDRAWVERETLEGAFAGMVQYPEYGPLMSIASVAAENQSTLEFLSTLHSLDEQLAGGRAGEYGAARARSSVLRQDHAAGELGWRTWEFQQCTETGVFFASEREPRVFVRDEKDFADECAQLFGTVNLAPSWNLERAPAVLADAGVSVFYVAGGKDPWFEVGLPLPSGEASTAAGASVYPLESGTYFFVPGGLHAPDRSKPELAREVFSRLRAGLEREP